jgi:hypothetical protein
MSEKTDTRPAEVAGIVIGVVTAVAGILALFRGWKFWKRKRNMVRYYVLLIRTTLLMFV